LVISSENVGENYPVIGENYTREIVRYYKNIAMDLLLKILLINIVYPFIRFGKLSIKSNGGGLQRCNPFFIQNTTEVFSILKWKMTKSII
ncbi:hypothetical protein, partial [Paenibacillus sp. Y412MC10]|uniref:hypothetical protein n=1 Tax=Geobacillus sp. (strain Y412MC10) TaxID=481743 RepID=UPI001C92C8D0